MRLLIAGGGTGGHIYPALAVARSLRARAGAPELGWLGGHRGLERTIVPGGRASRCAGSLLRSLRSAGRDVHLVLDPLRLGLSVPQAFVLLLRRRPAAIFTTGGYVAIPVAARRGRPADPERALGGQRRPGPQRPLRRRALATVLAVSHPATGGGARPPAARTSPARRSGRSRRSTPTRPARGSAAGPGERILLVFGGSQAVRRINDAVRGALPRLVERVRVVHVTGDDGYAAGARGPRGAARGPARPLPPVRRSSTATT